MMIKSFLINPFLEKFRLSCPKEDRWEFLRRLEVSWREGMSDDLYSNYPQYYSNADMKKIDDALRESNIDEALKTCKNVLEEKRPKPLEKVIKAHVLVHMGVLYYKKNDLANAKKMWDDALKLESYEPDAKHNMDKIMGGTSGKV